MTQFAENLQMKPSFLKAGWGLGVAIFADFLVVLTRTPIRKIMDDFDVPFPTITKWAIGPVLPIVLGAIVLFGVIFLVILVVSREDSSQQREDLLRIADKWHSGILALSLVLLASYGAGVLVGLRPLMHLIGT